MADVFCTDVCLWIRHVGCGLTRRALLGLEPGSRIWLNVEGEPILFERMADGKDGRSTRGLKPIGSLAERWREYFREDHKVLEVELIERPSDHGRAADRF